MYQCKVGVSGRIRGGLLNSSTEGLKELEAIQKNRNPTNTITISTKIRYQKFF
jgi:hypothetical protein